PAVEIGAHGVAMHPAMTFTGTDVDLDRLEGCVFGVTAEPADRGFAASLAADLGGRVTWIDEDKRVVYHAALAHGANHVVPLEPRRAAELVDVLDRGLALVRR